MPVIESMLSNLSKCLLLIIAVSFPISVQANPMLLGNIEPDTGGHLGGNSYPGGFVKLNGVTYFSASTSVAGAELWASDGLTVWQVADINPGNASSGPNHIFAMNNGLFFRATDEVNGAELWKTDGTEQGTVLVKDISSGQSSSNPWKFIAFGNALYFSARGELWKSDGTEAGTTLVTNRANGIDDLFVFGNALYFFGWRW